MLNINVLFFNISSKFVQTFCPICQQASECLMLVLHLVILLLIFFKLGIFSLILFLNSPAVVLGLALCTYYLFQCNVIVVDDWHFSQAVTKLIFRKSMKISKKTCSWTISKNLIELWNFQTWSFHRPQLYSNLQCYLSYAVLLSPSVQ